MELSQSAAFYELKIIQRLKFIILIALLTVHFGCTSSSFIKKTENPLLNILNQPPLLNHAVVPSRYWSYEKYLVHFITNANEENTKLSPIIYIHGLGGSLEDFSEIITLVHSHKPSRPYYAIDLPPFGKSLMNNSELSIHKYSKILQEFISTISSQKISLVCHSMGGQVCIDFAFSNPDQIQLLTLISPAGVYQRSTYINQTLNHYAGINIGSIDNPHATSINDLSWYNQKFTKKMMTNNPLILMAIESYKDNFHDRIKKLKAKTLIIWGHNDTVFNFENGLYLKENIESAVLYIIDNADHFPLKKHAEFISTLIQKNL